VNTASLFRLILLSAIWGASFVFLRIAAPVLGPVLLIFVRVALAASFLLVVAVCLRRRSGVRQHWRYFLVLGFFNSALPFLLIAEAARTVSASLLSILNATAPIWAAVIGAAWGRTRLAPRSLIGLALGIAGVALLAGVETLALPAGGWIAIAAALGAACSYGLATIYTKSARSAEPFANAQGSMWAATLLIAPAMAFAPMPAALPDARVIGSVIALGVLCSGVAYLLYFRLIEDIGATPTLTVTFLIPVFGVLWGAIFLDEAVGWHTLAGSLIVLTGTALVSGISPATVFARTVAHRA